MLNRTKGLWTGLILLLGLCLMGCKRGSIEDQVPPAPSSPTASSVAQTPYFPHHRGCWWEYGDAKDAEKLIKHEVVSADESSFEVQVSNPNVSFVVYGEDDEWIVQRQDRIPDKEITFDYVPPIKYLKKELKPGDKWVHEGKGLYDLPRHDDVTVGEVQEVTVPAGTFEVLPIKRVMKKGDRVDTETEYWAKDVGLVKSDFTSGDYHSVLELKSYHIPPK